MIFASSHAQYFKIQISADTLDDRETSSNVLTFLLSINTTVLDRMFNVNKHSSPINILRTIHIYSIDKKNSTRLSNSQLNHVVSTLMNATIPKIHFITIRRIVFAETTCKHLVQKQIPENVKDYNLRE